MYVKPVPAGRRAIPETDADARNRTGGCVDRTIRRVQGGTWFANGRAQGG
jgi:hypothetical protein